jgi:predicted regulator of Ras-like GTPase activity (Roadblock/LC7/MglB family)
MNFREELERICTRVEGALGAVILAEDGIIVERHVVDPAIDLELALLWDESLSASQAPADDGT